MGYLTKLVQKKEELPFRGALATRVWFVVAYFLRFLAGMLTALIEACSTWRK
jgi:hypothetical protein